MLSKERIFVEFNLILQIKDLYETLFGMYSSGVLLKVLSLENDIKTNTWTGGDQYEQSAKGKIGQHSDFCFPLLWFAVLRVW